MIIEFNEDGDELLPKGILEQHNDGGCFKLTLQRMIDPGDGLVDTKIYWSEDQSLLLEYAAHLVNKYYYPEIIIVDDSK
jgi:hypothetical protein